MIQSESFTGGSCGEWASRLLLGTCSQEAEEEDNRGRTVGGPGVQKVSEMLNII